MCFNERRLFLKLGLIYAAIHLFLYIPMHVSYQEFFTGVPTGVQIALGIAISVLAEIVNFALPILSASVLFISAAYRGVGHALLHTWIFALPCLVSAVPENYLKYLYYTDSAGAIVASLIFSVLTALIIALEILVLFSVMYLSVRKKGEGGGISHVCASIENDEIFNFSAPFTKALFSACLVAFAVRFVSEGIDTVSYLISEVGAYRAREALTIVFTFIFITLLFLGTYVAAYKLKSNLLKNRLSR